MPTKVVPCHADVTVTATGPITHRCPHVDETDQGTITITWRCAGETFELHSLAGYLASWADIEVAHEDLTDRIRHDLSTASSQVEDVTVNVRFVTAGLSVEVGGGLLRDPIDGGCP